MLTYFQNSFTDTRTGIFAMKSLLRIQSHLKRVATLPCEISVFQKLPCSRTECSNCNVRLSHAKIRRTIPDSLTFVHNEVNNNDKNKNNERHR